MATITLTANTNYSALSVANGDTINLAGFALTFDVNPAEINITVNSPGTNGTVVLGTPNTYDFTGWSFTAGNANLLTTIDAAKTVGGNWAGGAVANTRAIVTNNGTVNGNVTGGTTASAFGMLTNNGTINGNITGSSGQESYGVATNSGTINGNVLGGTVSGSRGVLTNNGLIVGNVTGRSSFNCHGVGTSGGAIIGDVTGGTVSTANGVGVLFGIVDGAIINGTGAAIGSFPRVLFCRGNLVQVTIPSTVRRFYSFGPLHPSLINNAVETFILSEGGGSAGFTGIRGVSRRLGA